jgi:hypothetical protein
MKKFLLLLAVAGMTAFTSCSGDDDSSAASATAISLTADVISINLGQTVTLNVLNNLSPAVDVTASSTFTANGTAFTGPTFTPTTAGDYVIVAKNGSLTSNEVTVTVAAVAVQNSIFVDGVNYSTNLSAVVFWGGFDLNNDGVADHAWWSTLAATGTAVGDFETSSNYIDIEFLTPLTSTGGVALPTTTNVVNKELYELRLNGNDVTISTQQSGVLVFAQNITTTPALTSAAFTYNAVYNTTSTLEYNYNSTFLGIFDASGRPAAEARNMAVELVTEEEVKARKAAFSFKK